MIQIHSCREIDLVKASVQAYSAVLVQPKGAASLLLSPKPGSEAHKTEPGSGQRVVELTDVF